MGPCDYAINPLLFKEGLTPPAGVSIIDSYEGMTAEEIYPTLDETHVDKHLYEPRRREGAASACDSLGYQ